MITATVRVKSVTAYSQSRHIEEPKRSGENDVDRELRCWAQRMHTTEDGYVFIPAVQFTNAVIEAAQHLSLPIPGKERRTMTKHFIAGVRCQGHLKTKWKAKDIKAESVFAPSNGKRGGGSRVTKYFPYIPDWEGIIVFTIADRTVTEEAFRKTLRCAGALIGIGRYRPKNMGCYGMFDIVEITWNDPDAAKYAEEEKRARTKKKRTVESDEAEEEPEKKRRKTA